MDYKNIFKNREKRLKIIDFFKFVPDKLYLKIVFKIKTGKNLNLKKPSGFNEKINWLKLNNKNLEYTNYVDKYEVRKIVASILGEEYLIPILGKWEKFEDIDFETLPKYFVLKCNHDSGSTKIIDKDKLDDKSMKELRDFFTNRLKMNTFYLGREYPYKNVTPCILAEKYIVDEKINELIDYKFFCFNGEVKLMYIATDRNIGDAKFDFYDTNFNKLNIENIHPNSGKIFEKPNNFEKMIWVSEKLSKSFPFVRIDLYSVNNNIYFGEYTFFHGGGFYLFSPYDWEKKLGDMISLDWRKEQ